MTAAQEDVVLKFVHTADWHLGRRFLSFGPEAGRLLSRARLDVLDRIFGEAERNEAHAVLCAGDLFDTHTPERELKEALVEKLVRLKWSHRRVVLLPGNHDPLLPDSVWLDPAFRAALPPFVTVVDRDLVELPLAPNCVLYAVPCTSKAGQTDSSARIPPRAMGDERVRVGLVHGSTFDVADWKTNFPISKDAAVDRGLDYLAIGDTHGFRFVPPERKRPPTIYPGAPEPMAFDEKGGGQVALVFINRAREALVQQRTVGRWHWETHTVTSMEQLRALARRNDLTTRVVKLVLQLSVTPGEYEEAETLLTQLLGTEVTHAKAGVLTVNREALHLSVQSLDEATSRLPSTLRATAERLQVLARDEATRAVAERALVQLLSLTREARGDAS